MSISDLNVSNSCGLGCTFNMIADGVGKYVYPGSPRVGFMVFIAFAIIAYILIKRIKKK